MLRQSILTIALLLTLAFPVWSEPQSHPLVAVEDGDTLVILLHGQETRVQLQGIDAPENVPNPKFLKDMQRTGLDSNQLLALGTKAQQHLEQLLAGAQIVSLSGNLEKQDKYGRLLVNAFTADGQSLNQLMVQHGYAITNKYSKLPDGVKQTLSTLQTQAFDSKAGLWKSDTQGMTAWSGIKP